MTRLHRSANGSCHPGLATVTRLHIDLAADLFSDCVSAPALVQRAGISYRQLDYWTRTSRLKPIQIEGTGRGQAFERRYPPTEIAVACLMGRFVSDGLTPQAAHDHARRLVETGTTRIAGMAIHLPTDL